MVRKQPVQDLSPSCRRVGDPCAALSSPDPERRRAADATMVSVSDSVPARFRGDPFIASSPATVAQRFRVNVR
jgi:hypothetical protein